ncbi:MAG: hypothetical protein NTW86_23230, partial [Candidatus Sumerlaeota bacterium]|nr:hypothetical protein [Candidatus Sumerlaeota bacterium]
GSLVCWDGQWFRLHRYVIMPNHVQILLEPLEKDLLEKEPAGKPALLEPALRKPGWKAGATVAPAFPPASSSTAREEAERHWLHSIMHSIKGYSAREANRVLGRRGSFWQREFFDHWARDEAEYARIVDYMDQNPVKAGLCGAADQWKWSSAGEETQTYS